jgi:hypothetical protein
MAKSNGGFGLSATARAVLLMEADGTLRRSCS